MGRVSVKFPYQQNRQKIGSILPLFIACLTLFILTNSEGKSFESSGQAVDTSSEQPKVGLALSGGGARGITHIGVLMALEEKNIPIDLITGTSMGSIVGGLKVAGYSGLEQKRLVDSIDWKAIFEQKPEPEDIWISQRYGLMKPVLRIHFDFWNISIPYGLNNGQRISEELFRLSAASGFAAKSNFDSLTVPYRAMAVDIVNGDLYSLGNGSLSQAMRSSMAIPLMFYPAIYEGKLMVDGGVLDVLPVSQVHSMGADVVIAVDVTEKPNTKRQPLNLFNIAANTIDIMVDKQAKTSKKIADVFIQPPIGRHPDTKYSDLDKLISIGYQATLKKMDEIKAVLKEKNVRKTTSPRNLDRSKLEKSRISRINIIGHEIVPGDSEILILKEPQLSGGSSAFLKRGVILAYFPFKEGDLFNISRALQGVENLYSTGLFQNIWLELDNPGDNKVILNIHFIPNPTRTIGIGANYFSDNGFSIFTQIVPFHFFGLGARFMPLARYGNVQKKAGLEISNSRFFSTALIFGGGGYYEKSSPYIYDAADDRQDQLIYESVIGQFSFGLQPFRKLIFSLGLRWQRIWQQESVVLNRPAVTHQNWSVLGTVILDSRDNRYFPQKGIYLMMEGEALLNYGIRGPQYRKLEAELNWTQSVFKRNYLTPFARTGLSENGLPVYTKFRLGGPLYLPGYHRDQIWGNNFAVVGIEYRLRIYKVIYFQMNGSAGNIFSDYSDIKFPGFIDGFSAGVSASTPVGPVHLLYGWNKLEKKQVYFSLGYTF